MVKTGWLRKTNICTVLQTAFLSNSICVVIELMYTFGSTWMLFMWQVEFSVLVRSHVWFYSLLVVNIDRCYYYCFSASYYLLCPTIIQFCISLSALACYAEHYSWAYFYIMLLILLLIYLSILSISKLFTLVNVIFAVFHLFVIDVVDCNTNTVLLF